MGAARIADPRRQDRSPGRRRRPQRFQHAAGAGARPRRRLLRQRPRAARRRPGRHVRSAGLHDRGGQQGRAAGPRLVQHEPRGQHGHDADEPSARRQRPPRVADGAAADRRRPRQARTETSALRAAPRRVDQAQRRGRRRAVCVAGLAGRGPARRARRHRHRHALPGVWRPPRLHPLPVEPVRPQPGLAARLPRVAAAPVVAFRSPASRRPAAPRSARLRRRLSGEVGQLPPPAPRRSRRPGPRRGASGPSRRAHHRRRDPRCPRGLRAQDAGLAGLGPARPHRRVLPDGLHGVAADLQPPGGGGPAGGRAATGVGRHRRVSADLGADHRSHRRRPQRGRGRCRAVQLRQPGRLPRPRSAGRHRPGGVRAGPRGGCPGCPRLPTGRLGRATSPAGAR